MKFHEHILATYDVKLVGTEAEVRRYRRDVAELREQRFDTKGHMKMANDKPDHIEQFFAYSHLPEHLQKVSKPFGDLAVEIVAELPRNPERTVALRKLLEAKDAAVRCKLAKEEEARGRGRADQG